MSHINLLPMLLCRILITSFFLYIIFAAAGKIKGKLWLKIIINTILAVIFLGTLYFAVGNHFLMVYWDVDDGISEAENHADVEKVINKIGHTSETEVSIKDLPEKDFKNEDSEIAFKKEVLDKAKQSSNYKAYKYTVRLSSVLPIYVIYDENGDIVAVSEWL